MKILVTGCAGFIGSHLIDRLLMEGYSVCGIDNFNDYYDPIIKERNLKQALKSKTFRLYRVDIIDNGHLEKIFKIERPTKIVHLAARAGVRPSIVDPPTYGKVNILGTVNLLKLAVDFNVRQFVLGSSSSVYGSAKKLPFSENDPCNIIVSPYGSSKRAAEFFVESFYRSFGLKSIILRFFTVYGPRGRPDMAPAIFTNAIINGQEIEMFGDGTSSRDYTYIDDIVDGVVKATKIDLNFEIINLGNNRPIKLKDFIETIELILGKEAEVAKMPKQKGDVEKTWANVVKAKKLLGWQPKTSLEEGLKKYVEWLESEKNY